jgi:ElaB/YqjD/DUF883 family membrane-anchored ribosome-binding protein
VIEGLFHHAKEGGMKTLGNGAHHGGDVGASVKAVGDSAGALSKEFQNFVADIEDLVKSSTSLTGDELAAAKDRIKDRIGQAKTMLGQTGESVAARARRSLAATNDYVNDEPWKAVGVSAGIGGAVGFLLGLLVARR